MDLKKRVSEVLKRLGISCDLLGYRYLREAIMMMVQNDDFIQQSMTKVIYPTIAKTCGATSTMAVERGMRYAISCIAVYGDKGLVDEIFQNSIPKNNTNITNSQFIAGVADYLTLHTEV